MAIDYRPVERRTLENLLQTQGLPGQFAYDVFQDTQQSALDRLLQQRAVRQQRQSDLQALLPEAATTLGQFAQAGLPGTVGAAAFSAAPPQAQGPLGALLGTLYPQGVGSTSPFAISEEGTAAAGLDAEEQAAIVQTAAAALDAAREEGDGATDFQSIFWGGLARQLTTAGFVGDDFEQAKELVRSAWERLGGTFAQTSTPTQSGDVGGGYSFLDDIGHQLGQLFS